MEGVHKENINPKEITSPILCDLKILASNISGGKNAYANSEEYSKSIKSIAKDIKQKLFELDVLKLPINSEGLREAYLFARKIDENSNSIDQDRSDMKFIASLIESSEGYPESLEKWQQEKNK